MWKSNNNAVASEKPCLPREEAQQLVVRGDGKGGGMAEARIAQAVHHRGKHVLKPEKLDE